jgi:hypothetical protein
VSANFTGNYPSYRITGLRLNIEFTFSNFRPMSAADPFNFQPQATMLVKANSLGSFVVGTEWILLATSWGAI